MTAAAIVVLDGFGIGAMPDAGELRAEDVRADTLRSICRWSTHQRGRPLAVPHLSGAGLAALRPDLVQAGLLPRPTPLGAGTARRAALGYPGADTYAGHQTMMGTDMSHVVLCRVGDRLSELQHALQRAGHRVELLNGRPLIVIDGAALLHDNLEADPGLNWNVSARLNDMPFENVLSIAQTVREIAPVARVIAVGGHSDQPLTCAVRDGAGGTVGLDTPASGFYRNGGLQVRHLGVPIAHNRQLPELVARAGRPVTLIGKAADILATDTAVHRNPGVETHQVLTDLATAIDRHGLTVANVQQTDLAGHQRDPARWAQLLEEVDARLPEIVARLHTTDVLIITGDHGNDPSIGHAFHTREYVPVLALTPGHPRPPQLDADLDSLADIGASIAAQLGIDPAALEQGRPRDLTPTPYQEQT